MHRVGTSTRTMTSTKSSQSTRCFLLAEFEKQCLRWRMFRVPVTRDASNQISGWTGHLLVLGQLQGTRFCKKLPFLAQRLDSFGTLFKSGCVEQREKWGQPLAV